MNSKRANTVNHHGKSSLPSSRDRLLGNPSSMAASFPLVAFLKPSSRYTLVSFLLCIAFLLLTVNHFLPGAAQGDYDTVDTALPENGAQGRLVRQQQHRQQLDTANSDYTNQQPASPKQQSSTSRRFTHKPGGAKKRNAKTSSKKVVTSASLNELTASRYGKASPASSADLHLGSVSTSSESSSSSGNQSKDTFLDLTRMLELTRLERTANESTSSSSNKLPRVLSLGHLNNIDLR